MITAVCVNTYPHTDMSIHARNIHASTYECPPNTVICSFMYLHSTLIYSANDSHWLGTSKDGTLPFPPKSILRASILSFLNTKERQTG